MNMLSKMQFKLSWLTLAAFALLMTQIARGQTGNLVKNGSFEGGMRYWFETEGKTLVKGDAASGEYALRIDKEGIASAAFLLVQGKPVTFSFSAKSVGGDATMGWQLTPCSREIGAKNGLTWGMRHAHPVKLTGEWKRYSCSFTPTASQDGFWPTPTYMIQIGDCDRPFLVDAVTISYGEGQSSGAGAYLPRREIEVQADSPDLKGYRDESGNLAEKGSTVSVVGVASNPQRSDRKITLRWQLFDYEGTNPVSDAVEKTFLVPAGKVVSDSVPMKLTATGLVLARVSAVENQEVIDSSDLPICSLPYPVEPRKPDTRERFGGSIFGSHSVALVSRMGFAWTRWRPQMVWSDSQPGGPDSFRWFDKELDQLESLGFSFNFVMYGKPKWALDTESD
jgi:hypothetical protein